MKRAVAAAGLCALLLGGCAPMAPQPGADTATELRWAQRREALANVLGFALSGRVAESGGRSAALRWRQFADARFTLQLSGPFGAGQVAIEGDPGGVWVRTKDGSQYTDDPRAWMRANLGWWLPLDDLRAWALGLPAPGAIEQLALDADGRLATLQQHGWTVRYDGYQRVGSLELPRKLEAQTESVRLRLVVDSWTAVDLAKRS